MKKISYFALTVFIILSTVPSCRKVYDFIQDHPDAHDSLCPVTKVTVMGLYGVPDIMEVTYNAKGNPLVMGKTNELYYIVNDDQHFRYDKFDRLSDYIITFPESPGAIQWHKYFHPPNGSIKVVDTLMVDVGNVNDPPPNASAAVFYTITGFTFDAHGRIWQRWDMPHQSGQQPQFLFAYTYDANGNLPLYGTKLIYDNKVNVLRTNEIWQFIAENYSRNNLMPATSFAPAVYNEFGLPVSYPNIQFLGGAPIFGLTNTDSVMTIEYACSIPKGPIKY